MTGPDEDPLPTRRTSYLRSAILVAGLAAIAVTVRATVSNAEGLEAPSLGALLAALVLTRLALSAGARAWVGLIGPPADPHLVTAALYQSQLVKYLPAGGVAQAAGQVTLTAMQGVSLRRVSLAYLALSAATVAAGLTLASSLTVLGEPPGWVRLVAPLGLLAPLLLRRGTLEALLGVARRLSARVPEPDDLPGQRALWGALAWCIINLLLYASGFAVLLHSIDGSIPVVSTTAAYIVAWVIGFLVLPIPAGVGIREAVLVAIVPGVTAAPLLAASLAQRLVAIAAELLAVAVNRVLRDRR